LKPRLHLTLLLAAAVLTAPGVPLIAQQTPSATGERPRLSRLQGTAKVDRRTPVVGAVVEVRPEDDPAQIFLTSTNEDGELRIDGLPDGTYVVRIDRSGFRTVVKTNVALKFPFRAVVEVTLEHADEAVRPAVQSPIANPPANATGIAVTGLVTEAGGAPLSEVRLRFVHPGGWFDPRLAETGDDGRFEFSGMQPAAWRVEIIGVGFLPVRTVLDLRDDTRLDAVLVRQPADYVPSPLELMPEEHLTPPPGLRK